MHLALQPNVPGNQFSEFTVTLIDDGPSDPARGDVSTSGIQTFKLFVTTPNYQPFFDLSVPVLQILEDSGMIMCVCVSVCACVCGHVCCILYQH